MPDVQLCMITLPHATHASFQKRGARRLLWHMTFPATAAVMTVLAAENMASQADYTEDIAALWVSNTVRVATAATMLVCCMTAHLVT